MMKRLLHAVLLGAIVCSAGSLSAKSVFNRGEALPGAPSSAVMKIEKSQAVQLPVGSELSKGKKVMPSARIGEELCEVKCLFKYDPETYQPSDVCAYNASESVEEYYDWENDYVYLYVAPGMYDFRTVYTRVSETSLFGEAGNAYLILEDIEVNGDMEIELDASLITEVISFETYNPDGEKSALRYIRYLNEDYDWEIISEYNVYDIYVDNFILRKDYAEYSMHSNAAGVEVEPGPCGEWKAEWVSNIYINPVSDKYQLAQLRMLYNEEECWIVPMFADGSRTQTVTNDGAKYSDLYNVEFAKTPAGIACDVVSDTPYLMQWGMNNSFEPSEMSWGLNSSLASFMHFRFCPTASLAEHPDYICYMNFAEEDTAEIRDIDREYDDEGNLIYEYVDYATTAISSPMFVLGMDSCTLYPQIDNRFLCLEKGGMKYDNSFQSQLSYEVSPQSMPVFGSTSQFLQFFYMNYESEWYDYPYPMLTYTSYGYYGDYRSSDEGEVEVSINGNVVASSAEELYEWQMACMENPMETGTLVFDYKNTNIEVDGLPGRNIARISIDTAAENFHMPLIQSVQFRDATNNVTDRFTDASEGRLVITGGDFLKVIGDPALVNGFGETPMWYDIEACAMSVEYAPYGSNDFAVLEMEQDGEPVIGFGMPYEGSLECVDRESDTGWFDLRISIYDVFGNTHEQVISPAFNVAKLTGVKNVAINTANLRVKGNAIIGDGAQEIEVYTISGQRVENRDLPSGIYLARSGESIAKLVVR